MHKDKMKIPVHLMTDNFSQGISIDKIRIKKSDFETVQQYGEVTPSHRDEGLAIVIEVDFHQYEIKAPTAVYMYPNQVHRILDFKDTMVLSLAIKNENIKYDYLDL